MASYRPKKRKKPISEAERQRRLNQRFVSKGAKRVMSDDGETMLIPNGRNSAEVVNMEALYGTGKY